MKTLYKFTHDGYYASHYGVFVAESERMDALIEEGATVRLGEADGKHSDVTVELNKDTVERVAYGDDPDVLAFAHNHGLIFGYDPIAYLDEQEDE